MTILFYIGVALTVLGLAGIFWFIQRVRRLKDSEASDDSVQAELRFLVALNMGAVGLAFMGLALALVGLLMG